MRSKEITRNYYINNLGFVEIGEQDHEQLIMIKRLYFYSVAVF